MTDVFCPWCGAPADASERELRCTATGSLFTANLTRRIRAWIEAPPQPVDPAFTTRWGGPFACPACGTEVHGTDTSPPVCPTCQRNLGPLLYELIEINPHEGWVGRPGPGPDAPRR